MRHFAQAWQVLQRHLEAVQPALAEQQYDFVLLDEGFKVISPTLSMADTQWLTAQLNRQVGMLFAARMFCRSVIRYYTSPWPAKDVAPINRISASVSGGGIRFRALLAALSSQASRDRDRLSGSAAVNKLTLGRPYLYAVRLVPYGLLAP
ncbi:hypothetical protein [Chitinimonas naiadis]